jgi:hypothetical protein
MDYWMIKTGDGPGIDGGLMQRAAPGQGPNNVVAVPDVGWTAYFADPEGNAFGIMQCDAAAA